MGSENITKESWNAVEGPPAPLGDNAQIGAGPEAYPNGEVFENAGKPGNYWGDKTIRKMPSQGADLSLGLSCRMPFEDETADDLGMGRDMSTGKPDGPEMGKVNNEGASAEVEWG